MIGSLGATLRNGGKTTARVLLALGIAGFVAQQSHAYTLNGSKWPAGSEIVLQLRLGDSLRPLLDGKTSWNPRSRLGISASAAFI